MPRTGTDRKLDLLVRNGSIDSYSYKTIESVPGSGNREYETIVLNFKDGTKLSLTTFCSGSLENTHFILE